MFPLLRTARLRHPTLPLRPSLGPIHLNSALRSHLLSARPSTTSAPNSPNATPDFSALPPYKPPTSGFLSHLPPSWIPYAELSRLDKPTGTYYLFLPCLWSTLLAGHALHSPPLAVATTIALFFTGAVVMRGAGCTINDIWDRNFDPLVTRTRLRPIARGAVNVRQAVLYLGGQLGAGLAVLLQFPMSVWFYAVPSLLLVTVYPLMKRITNYPQIVLGMAFSWGSILGFPALGMDLLHDPHAMIAAGALVVSNTAWTVLYDTVYAHQDVKDDRKAGVKSIVVKHEGHTRELMSGLALVQTVGLGVVGWAMGLGPVYYGVSVLGALGGNLWMIWRAKLGNSADCWGWFKWCAWAVGGLAIGGGLGGEYLLALWRERTRVQVERRKAKAREMRTVEA
ncbi:4-hydroxybenzoate polyprenyl transferase [Ascobolus immersus RN42]|uniref:4-hydroxybenzoate polyprenyltransferase, mitochondrial n=1 Tax=Ascobolus immersus RN42 TaxID=1160509 RepID=A0A3N4I491_ASCIM|nr:4-hydroxybenzoate polyprenyl transferase [Ascobolus immersus RN42]